MIKVFRKQFWPLGCFCVRVRGVGSSLSWGMRGGKCCVVVASLLVPKTHPGFWGKSTGLLPQGLTLVPGMKPVLVLSSCMKVFPDTARDGGRFAGKLQVLCRVALEGVTHPALMVLSL